jgi:hypothetical protein
LLLDRSWTFLSNPFLNRSLSRTVALAGFDQGFNEPLQFRIDPPGQFFLNASISKSCSGAAHCRSCPVSV